MLGNLDSTAVIYLSPLDFSRLKLIQIRYCEIRLYCTVFMLGRLVSAAMIYQSNKYYCTTIDSDQERKNERHKREFFILLIFGGQNTFGLLVFIVSTNCQAVMSDVCPHIEKNDDDLGSMVAIAHLYLPNISNPLFFFVFTKKLLFFHFCFLSKRHNN